MEARTLVVGDIHGAYKALVQVLEKVELRENDKLIFVGDYVDGWPESASVIEYLINLSEKYSCIFIKGNHDVWCKSWLAGNDPDKAWLENRGMSTILSYQDFDQKSRSKHLDFFSRLTDYYIDKENRLFIHAGFTSIKGPLEEIFSHNFNNDRTLLETAAAMDKNLTSDSVFYPKRLALFFEIYIGHTPTTKYNVDIPMHGGNLWDVDTGAAREGKISVMDIVTKEFWQSDRVKDLYGI
ncbi:metallophosphoesterase family protein [Dyadobacter frigoris]|uniref:Serine/threonine protein phosphatase n=1 Tax=Dyadobacter frigoris TaxID=2576211 RepID=A0A4U6D485_9BACT|nr:metallophosphoesterase family protein [Dyadobacter frigoris]TKT90768.1 serine/threonine protein phosphatase [Dyadobacter frigoris]GLU52103.1 metallophosphatase [Dyadobacter frigoris]